MLPWARMEDEQAAECDLPLSSRYLAGWGLAVSPFGGKPVQSSAHASSGSRKTYRLLANLIPILIARAHLPELLGSADMH